MKLAVRSFLVAGISFVGISTVQAQTPGTAQAPTHGGSIAAHSPQNPAQHTLAHAINCNDDCIPSPPTNVAASDTMVGQVLVTWTPIVTPPECAGQNTNYRLYRGTSAAPFNGTQIATLHLLSSSFPDTTAQVGVTYYYALRTYSKFCGLSALSNIDSGMNNFAAPGVPSNVSASDGSSTTQISINWTAPTSGGPISGYNLAQSETDQPGGGAIINVGNVTNYVVDVVPGSTFFFSVQAVGQGGTSAWSACDAGSASFTPPSSQAIEASDAMATDSIEIVWSSNSDSDGGPVTSFDLYRSQTPDPCLDVPYVTGISATSSLFMDGGVGPGETYYYCLIANGPGGSSVCSNVDQGSTAEMAPNAPSDVVASDGTSTTTVTVNWAAPISGGPVSGYDVYRSTTANPCSFLRASGVVGTQFIDDAVTAGEHYFYSVKAVGAGGSSDCSNVDEGWAQPSGPVVLLSEDFETGSGTTWPNGWAAVGTPAPDALWHVAAVNECTAPTKRAAYNNGDTGVCTYVTGLGTSGSLTSFQFVPSHAQLNISGTYTKALDPSGDSVTIFLRRVSPQEEVVFVANADLQNTSSPTVFNKSITAPASFVGQPVVIRIFFNANASGNQGSGFSIDDIVVSE